jgi:hypothetical protein
MRGLIGDLCIKTYLINQNPAETCQVFGKNFSGQLYHLLLLNGWDYTSRGGDSQEKTVIARAVHFISNPQWTAQA